LGFTRMVKRKKVKSRKKGLSDQHKRFCQEYVIDFNRVRAYRKAYPKCKSNASAKGCVNKLMLSNTILHEFIERLLKKQAKRAEKGADDIIKEMEKIGFSNIKDYLKIKDQGVVVKNTEDISDDKAAAIASVSQTETKDGGSIKFTLYNKVTALELLGRRYGIFPNRTELSGLGGQPIQIKLITFK